MVKIGKTKVSPELIVEALGTPKTYADIAKQFGISKQRVGQIAKQYNVARYINIINELKSQSEEETNE